MPQLQSVILSLALAAPVLGRFRTSYSPEDTYSFPKFRVNFVNNRPITPDDAQVLLSTGLKYGADEFLGRTPTPKQEIEASGTWTSSEQENSSPSDRKEPKLHRMKFGSNREYLCLVPKNSEQARIVPEEPEPVDPSKSWALLAPLTGQCLYHRQGWFTYAYCHNRHVRQFREKEHAHPHPPGGRIPKEDPEFQAYTLGFSPEAISGDEKDVSTRERKTTPSGRELQLATGGGQRYLTSRWTDGTRCDKTGKKREIEIQFHCGMTSTDSIQFLKETSVCKYLLVLHTPRLCGEPGFRSAKLLQPAEPIHCREIMERSQAATLIYTDPQSDFPYANTRPRNPIHLPNHALQQEKKAKAKAGGVLNPGLGLNDKQKDALKKIVSQLFKGKDKKAGKATGGDKGSTKSNKNAKGSNSNNKAQGAAAGGGGEKMDKSEFKIDLDQFEEELGTILKDENGDPLYVQVLDLEGGEQDIEQALTAALTKQAKAISKKLSQKDQSANDDEEGDFDYQDDWHLDDAL